MRKILSILILLFFVGVQAQNYKFGKVSEEELKMSSYAPEPDAPAVILYAERITVFNYDYDRGFSMNTAYFMRMKIFKKEGFDYATKVIKTTTLSSSDVETVKNIKAYTYYLDNGKIEKVKLENNNIFKNKVSKYREETSFTMPNISEGCVVEWSYDVDSYLISQLDDITVQAEIPVVKSYNKIFIPEYINYNNIAKGYLNVPLEKDKKSRSIGYNYSYKAPGELLATRGNATLDFAENVYLVEMSNIPSIKEEPYCGNIDNYKAGMSFELIYTKFPNSTVENYSMDWDGVTKKIYEYDDFGGQFKLSNYFENDINALLIGKNTPEEKINAIYQFVQKKIQFNNILGYYTDNGVKKSFKDGIGNVGDININLINMLRYVGIDANPVLASTIDNGIPLFPSRNGFNYVIARAYIGEKSILLDATNPLFAPGIISPDVLNFQGREINKDGSASQWVDLFPEKHSATQINVSATLTDENISGNMRILKNKYSALAYRIKYSTLYENKETMMKEVAEKFKGIDVLDYRINNFNDTSKDLSELVKFEIEGGLESISNKLFLNPMLFLQTTENEFKLETRSYPVFFKTPYIENYVILLTLPEYLKVEKLPTATEIVPENNLGKYIYKITQEGQQLKIESTLIIDNPVVPGTHYKDLKSLFDEIIKKQNEKVVLVKY